MVSRLRTGVLVVLSLLSTSAWTKGADDVRACQETGRGAVEAARLRDQDVGRADAVERLRSRVGPFAGSAVDLAYAHPGLRDYPLENFTQVYCMTSRTWPWLRDVDLVMLKARLDVSEQCAAQGHLDRTSFTGCLDRAGIPAR